MRGFKELTDTDRRCFEAAQGWLALGDWREANESLDNITPIFRAHPDVLALRWAIYAKAEKHDMAFEVARGLVELVPDDASSWLKQAESLTIFVGSASLRAPIVAFYLLSLIL